MHAPQLAPLQRPRRDRPPHTPSSLYPEHFFDVDSLIAACKPCNFADGAKLRNANARNREAQLRSLVEEQRQEIERLLERLSRYEIPDGRPVKRPMPAIY
jgi:hypothetical protein